MNRQPAIGIDLGKTIYFRIGDMKLPMPGSFRVIRRLVQERFGERTYIVSRVDVYQKIMAEARIKEDGLCELTGILPENVHFCAERRDKADICTKLGITHFIDDRPEVISHMDNVPTKILMNPVPEDYRRFQDKMGSVLIARNWSDIERLLL